MIHLVRGTLIRVIGEMKRYLLNLISSIIIFLIIFLLIALGFKTFGQGQSLSFRNTAVGYFVWMSVMINLTDLSWTIMNDMQRGIIEQVFISPFGPLVVYTTYELLLLVIELPIVYGMMVLIFSMANMSVHVHPSFFYFLVLAMLQSLGMGYVLAGVTLKYKRTQALLNLAQFALIGLLFVSTNKWLMTLVPIAPHFRAMSVASEGKVPSWEYFLITAIGTALYMAIGVFIFSLFSKSTLKKGELSMY